MDIDIQQLSKVGRLMKFAKGENIFIQGDMGKEMYFVISGTVTLTSCIIGRQTCLAEVGQGEIFGEMALIENLPRCANANAKTDCVLFEVTETNFDNIFASMPQIAIRIVKRLSAIIRDQNRELTILRNKK